MANRAKETWDSGDAYERYVGRWSRLVAADFLEGLHVQPGSTWGDVGCGTGVLTERIFGDAAPAMILATDRAPGFIRAAQDRLRNRRVYLSVGDALALAWASHSCDVTVSGLVLNFVSSPKAMAAEMVRVTRPGGTVAAYVWDYAGGMQMMRHFWDVVVELYPHDSRLDQAERFPICQPEPLENLFQEVGLSAVTVRPIDIDTVFHDFDDYWTPFLGKQGAAPTYLASLDAAAQDRIRDALKARLPIAADGSIRLSARAWAVKGIVPRRA